MRRIAPLTFAILVWAAEALGQELTVSVASYQTFGIGDLGGDLPPMIDVRYGFPVSPRSVFEVFVAAGSERRGVRRRVEPFAFFGGQVRRRLYRLDSSAGHAFVTLGAAGFVSRWDFSPPIFGHFGVGLRRGVSSRLAVRPELQLVTFHVVPIGMRFLVGGSVDLHR